ncbi:hypothetical protein [Clostridium sp. OS1-26]|uniref:hypothetical protein n=1 Tax=Clostridium sp. OS1-26 TaxID=3070681 RepID=UPI0027E21077|nr:hypothetical protein [Clostridium sp. OS1-26]WML33497.1 hypothetical protein RCG18_19400 [Clostridium sp. OS1-26]
MGLEHKIFLVTKSDYEEIPCNVGDVSLEDMSNCVLIHNDIIQYIGDTLRWIPSINPGNGYEKGFGLNNYGITLFDKEGAAVILNIAKLWADLFSNGTPILKLKGSYCWTTNDKGVLEGEYEIIEVNRDELVSNIRKLQSLAEKVIHDSSKYFIIHHGI